MAQLESFLEIEGAVQRALRAAWEEAASPIVDKMTAAVEAGDMDEADRLVEELSLGVVEEAFGRVEFLFRVAIMFGAGQMTREGRTVFDERGLPDLPEVAFDNMLAGLRGGSEELIRRRAVEVLAEVERLRAEERDRSAKAETVLKQTKLGSIDDVARALNDATIGTGRQLIDAGANLSTSRLVSFGFLSEANQRQVDTYQITEVLDSRTCPICRRMHGRTFMVSQPLARIEQQLRTTDPQELKSAWPFPKATKAGLRELDQLSQSDLQGRGWDAPPFHVSCRGVLQRTGTVSRLEGEELHAADPVSGLSPVVPDEPGLAFGEQLAWLKRQIAK